MSGKSRDPRVAVTEWLNSRGIVCSKNGNIMTMSPSSPAIPLSSHTFWPGSREVSSP